MESRTLETRGGRTKIRVHEGGRGEPLLFLHGAGGLLPGDPFLAALSERFRVAAPLLPGYEDSEGAESLRSMLDFTLWAFDVVDARGRYVGGIIAPGLAAMTDYLHEKTALLPRIKIREVRTAIGKSTEQAMLIGAVHGYRGLVRELIAELRKELKVRRVPVVATGGYAKLIAAGLPEIEAVAPDLTLEGLRLVWRAHTVRSKTR